MPESVLSSPSCHSTSGDVGLVLVSFSALHLVSGGGKYGAQGLLCSLDEGMRGYYEVRVGRAEAWAVGLGPWQRIIFIVWIEDTAYHVEDSEGRS